MILLDAFDSLKAIPSQPDTDSEDSGQHPSPTPSSPDSPPPYSRPVTPAQQHTSSESTLHRQPDRDVEANSSERSHSRFRKRRGQWARKFSVITLFSLVIVTTWRFVVLEEWEHHVGRFWSSSQTVRNPFQDHKHDLPPPRTKPHTPAGLPSDASEIEKEMSTLRSFCVARASWSPTVRHPKEIIPHHSSSISLHLPLDASSLFLLARVPNASGKLQILQSSTPNENPRVFLTARHLGQRALEPLSVCLMEKLPGVVGVGIFTDTHSTHDESLDFDVTLLLPPSSPNNFAYNLETDLPKFSHKLDTSIPLGSVHLKSKGMAITGDIKAREVIIQTSHGSIQGAIRASELVSISTTHSPIDVNVTLENDHSYFSSIDISNTDSTIKAYVALTSSSERAKYEVKVKAPNTALDMIFPSAPANSVLRLESITSEKPSQVLLPPQYEGDFTLTSLGGETPAVLPRTGSAEQLVTSVSSQSRSVIVRGRVPPPTENEGLEGSVSITTSKTGSILVV